MKGNADIMAFVNEKLTPEQQQEVNSWEISYPRCAMGQILKTDILVNPWYWTVDKERKIYLFGIYHLLDYFLYIHITVHLMSFCPF